MKCLSIAPLLLVVGLFSCDKAKHAVDAAREKIGGVTDPGAPADPGGQVDSGFAAQVDSAAEGVRFRRDLEFPASMTIRLVERQIFKNARMITQSELGNQTASYSGTWEMVGSIERDRSRVDLAIEKFGEVLDLRDKGKEAAVTVPSAESRPPLGNEVAGAKVGFGFSGDVWRISEKKGAVDFRNKVLGDALLPALPELLTIHGGMPRTQWFSSTRRWIGGDKFVLEGEALALLFPGNSSGKVTLVFEEPEALEGHPCGRFAVTGDVTLAGRVGLDGEVRTREITINSGKVWCSLIHPLVLREEYQTLQTIVTGKGRGPRTRIQGAVDHVVSRGWRS
jgi:hypothetical protein